MRRSYKWLIIVGAIVVVLVAIRLALPSFVRDYVNDQLMALAAYDGHVDDIDLALWRGAYRIDGIRIVKTGTEQPVPFFSGDRIDLSIEWGSLVRGSLVAEGEFFRPQVNLVQAKDERHSQLGEEENWGERFEQLFPFDFNTIKVHDGTVTFRAPGIRTEDALRANHVNGTLSNLTNVVESDTETFSRFGFDAEVLEGGTAKIDGSVNPLARQPTFDVNLTVRNVQLPQVNPWLRQYIKADAEDGEFELYMEIAAADGRFQGYAKPLMRNIDIYSSEEPEKNPLKRIWEGLVEFAANVLENDETGQVAARVPFTGTIENPETSIFATIASVVRNAFVSAFARSLEGSISVRAVRRNLEEVSKQDDERKKPDR